MSDLKTLVRGTLKRYGKDAAAHFGVAEGTLASYKKTGKFPLSFVEKVLSEAAGPVETGPEVQKEIPTEQAPPIGEAPTPSGDFLEPLPMANGPRSRPAARQFPAEPPPTPMELRRVQQRLDDLTKYLQTTVDFYIRQFSGRIGMLEKGVIALSNAQLRATGMPSLARPDENVPVEQTFTTNPNSAPFYPNALNTGIAPTKEMVDAQAMMTTLEGVPVPNARVAHPAEFIPNLPGYGFGWNQPRPRK